MSMLMRMLRRCAMQHAHEPLPHAHAHAPLLHACTVMQCLLDVKDRRFRDCARAEMRQIPVVDVTISCRRKTQTNMKTKSVCDCFVSSVCETHQRRLHDLEFHKPLTWNSTPPAARCETTEDRGTEATGRSNHTKRLTPIFRRPRHDQRCCPPLFQNAPQTRCPGGR